MDLEALKGCTSPLHTIDAFYKLWDYAWHGTFPLFEKTGDEATGYKWILKLDELHVISGPFQIKHAMLRLEYLQAVRATVDAFTQYRRPKEYDPLDFPSDPQEWVIDQLARTRAGGTKAQAVAIIGHPGIGKSVWLYIVLVCRLRSKQVTIFETTGKRILFHDGPPLVIPELDASTAADLAKALPKHTWYMIDVGLSGIAKITNQATTGCRLLVAASYREGNLEFTSKVITRQYVMTTWSEEEILQCREFSTEQAPDVSDSDMLRASRIFGPSLRHLFQTLPFEDRMATLHNTIDSFREQLDFNTINNIFTTIGAQRTLALSHSIVVVEADEHNRTKPLLRFASSHILELVLQAARSNRDELALSLYESFSPVVSLHAPAGQILENCLTRVLLVRNHWPLRPLVTSQGPKRKHWRLHGTAAPQYLTLGPRLKIGDEEPTHVDNNPPDIPYFRYDSDPELAKYGSGYYQPSSGSQASFDSFIYDQQRKYVVLFQCTLGQRAAGYKWLRNVGVDASHDIVFIAVQGQDDCDFEVTNEAEDSTTEKYHLQVNIQDMRNAKNFYPQPQNI